MRYKNNSLTDVRLGNPNRIGTRRPLGNGRAGWDDLDDGRYMTSWSAVMFFFVTMEHRHSPLMLGAF